MEDGDFNEGYVLHQLHNNIWMEELLSQYFAFIVDNILSKRQRQILELKVQECSGIEICKLLNIKEKTLERQIDVIQSKFRNKLELRVDNLKPGWMKKYGKKTKKKISKK